MSEAQQLYQAILCALEPLLPRAVYREVRRVRTLAWAITGLCLSQSVHLSAWAQLTQGRAKFAASRERRFSRWLHHRDIVPSDWYRPVIQAALSNWPAGQRLYLALDTTALSPFVLIRVSLIYRGRALPLAWRAMRHQSTTVAFEDYQPVLEQVLVILPANALITLLADRGFVHERLLHYLRHQHWHFRLRLMSKTLVHLTDQSVVAGRRLRPSAGESRFFQHVWLLGAAVGPVHLALTCLLERQADPWLVVSDEPTDAATFSEYALRFDVEESFKDDQSGGFQLQRTHLASADALERLLLILALATLYLTNLGVSVEQADKRRWADPHWRRRLSYLQLGWRWRKQQVQRGWQAFPSFQLDPVLHPPLAPSRLASSQSGEEELVAAA